MNTIPKLMLLLTLLCPLFAHAVGEPYAQNKLDALSQTSKPMLVFTMLGSSMAVNRERAQNGVPLTYTVGAEIKERA
jgi:hypothetical protein